MTDVATLALEVRSDQVKAANLELRQMPQAASAAERAAQKWGLSADAAGKSSEEFSRRVRRNIEQLEFQRAQLTRSAAEQERYAALRKAGVAAESAAGQAILQNVAALQAERLAQQAAADAMRLAQRQAAGFAALASQQAAEEQAAAQQRERIAQRQAEEQMRHEAQRRAVARTVIADLEFERQQLTRAAALRERYAAIRRAGVDETSAEGQAIMASVAALQAQRAALDRAAESKNTVTQAATAGAGALAVLVRAFGPLAAGFSAAAVAQRVWQAGMKAADIGEQAAQVNLLAEQLQAYRFVAAQNGVTNDQLDASLIRLTASMGAAFKGGEEQIKVFDRLGVKLLDTAGNLRGTADVLPELARGLLGVRSETERNALMTELFGRSGARMVTMLQDWAKGNDALVASARQHGALVSNEVSAAWDRLADRLKIVNQQLDAFLATIGAPIIVSGLEHVLKVFESTRKEIEAIQKAWQWLTGASLDGLIKREAELRSQLAELVKRGEGDSGLANMLRRRMAEVTTQMAKVAPVQLPDVVVTAPAPSAGASQPVPKGQADAWQKLITQGQQYIAQKNVETQALDMNAEAAARLVHEQQLLAKAANDNIRIGPQQLAQIQAIAAGMAAADTQFKSAKFMDDFNRSAEQFIQQQQIERDTLYMTTEAAMAYRLEQEAINRAKAEGLVLTPQQIAQIQELARAQAASAEATRKAKEWVDFEKQTFREFFSEINRGLREGANVWDVFGNAAMNVLNKISDKLMQMAADQLFEAAFGGTKGGGGIFGGIGGWISGLFGGGGGGGMGTGFDMLSGLDFSMVAAAKGAAFNRGTVIPFARGGIVDRPTLFPMARGAGLMGEAGPEGILPLRRGRNGRLGVEASGGGMRPVIVQVTGDTDLVRVTARGEAVQVVKDASPGIVKESVQRSGDRVVPIVNTNRFERGGDYRVA